jgi:hypothetical protein
VAISLHLPEDAGDPLIITGKLYLLINTVMKIPPNSNRLMPYIIVPGAYKFAEFMKNVFGATEQTIIPRSEGVLMHGEVRIGD